MAEEEVISPETSKRICAHMNNDHAATLYAMIRARSLVKRGFSLTEARMKKITAEGCSLQAVSCSGDLCNIDKVEYEFDPPLRDASQARKRLVAIHREVW